MCQSSSTNPTGSGASNQYAHPSLNDSEGRPFLVPGVSPSDSDASIEDIVEYYHPFILSQVKLMAYLPGKLSCSAEQLIEPDDIAQEVSISFWKRLQKETIVNPEAYIRRMVRNEYIDAMRRRHINLQPLIAAENGELLEDEVLSAPGEGMSDPAEEFEEQTAINDLTEKVASAVSMLPPRQQRAAVRMLLKRVDNLLQVVEALETHQVTLEGPEPEDEVEIHRLQASFSPARLALAKKLDVDLALYKRSRPR